MPAVKCQLGQPHVDFTPLQGRSKVGEVENFDCVFNIASGLLTASIVVGDLGKPDLTFSLVLGSVRNSFLLARVQQLRPRYLFVLQPVNILQSTQVIAGLFVVAVMETVRPLFRTAVQGTSQQAPCQVSFFRATLFMAR